MTNPGYPAYRASIYMANAKIYAMPMLAREQLFPRFIDKNWLWGNLNIQNKGILCQGNFDTRY
jgi:hypothetical protein